MAVVYHRALVFPFALDDYGFLFRAAGLLDSTFELRRYLTTQLFYKLGLRTFGLDVLPWHLFILALHVGNALWVHVLALRLGCGRYAAWLACGLFTVSPLAFTVVYWIAGIQEISSTFFVLAATFFALKQERLRWLSLPLFALGVLCKESVLLVPIALFVLLGRRGFWLCATQLALAALLFFAAGLHQRAFDSQPGSPYATTFDWTMLHNLATLIVWFVAPWRPYPDRIATADPTALPWAGGVVLFVAAIAVVLRQRGVRWFGQAALWFLMLVIPILPLRAHLFAYYLYAAQCGFLLLLARGIAELGSDLAGRDGGGRALWVRGIVAMLAVAVCASFAARNAHTHETLMLPQSQVPHDSIVRYGHVSQRIVEQIAATRFQPGVERITIFQMPEGLGANAQTPGEIPPGAVRVRLIPMRVALYEGRLLQLHFGIDGAFVDELTPRDEDPDTAIFMSSGLSRLEFIPDPAEAHAILAQGHMLVDNREIAEREAERALQLHPGHGVARVLLAEIRVGQERFDEAEQLLNDLDLQQVPRPLHPTVRRLQQTILEKESTH